MPTTEKQHPKEYCSVTAGSLTLNGTLILHDINLKFSSGEIVLVTGHNGAGKTSLLRILSEEVPLSRGSLTWKKDRPRTVFLSDNPWVYDMLTVWEHADFFARMWGKTQDIDALLKDHGLHNHRDAYGTDLSLGLKQRLLFALTCLGEPDMLLLDEPFNGLDKNAVTEFIDRIQALAVKGCCVVIVSHYQGAVTKTFTREISLSQGRVISDGISAGTSAPLRHGTAETNA